MLLFLWWFRLQDQGLDEGCDLDPCSNEEPTEPQNYSIDQIYGSSRVFAEKNFDYAREEYESPDRQDSKDDEDARVEHREHRNHRTHSYKTTLGHKQQNLDKAFRDRGPSPTQQSTSDAGNNVQGQGPFPEQQHP
uniref:Uncharacterized protein n=1 Tax=Lygus hesperus TaxID=30085 RepID=A0A146LD60_LYGHE